MKTLITSAAVSMALLAAGPAMAESTQNQGYQNPAATGTQKTDYTDAQLKKFVNVQEDISDIREQYIPQIEKTDDKNKAQQLQMEANDKMVNAIQEKGLDIPTYNAIATAYNSEPQVRNRVDALM
ncbi:hypothetical protein RE428_15490 [Marinobacter nanhaiticus D15-8W]|uniref:DUF4168 domain-containing protein n=1 Tax=Marinobacter nanhaiticus D15-8W TaxID=626887 RepID=N6WNS4_9GAMM|nr:DUF4168 domain-containing protein [Marinobacter nanhaiticus]ENO13171.1 DUF4168 domain-containing protein [Marinobacter nanhaiticus D15-8W]BES70531.1 hypothetical protein RE428_15490 [Marinobacter nanhaiticus D15-8W]